MNIKYEQGLYNSKIATLETLYNQLGVHLSNMEGLKDKMYQFWDDEEARKTGNVLVKEIRSVKSDMSRTQIELANLKGTVEKQTGLQKKQQDRAETAEKIIDTVVKFLE